MWLSNEEQIKWLPKELWQEKKNRKRKGIEKVKENGGNFMKNLEANILEY